MDHKAIMTLLKTHPEKMPPVIKDPVRIRVVDLHEYDALKEVAYAD